MHKGGAPDRGRDFVSAPGIRCKQAVPPPAGPIQDEGKRKVYICVRPIHMHALGEREPCFVSILDSPML